MSFRKIVLIALFALFGLHFNVYAKAPEAFYLPNGLKVIVKEDHRAPVAVHMIWYRAGSMDETSGTTGVAHVLEHMMFKGTPKYPEGSLSKLVARLGGRDNAFTSSDYTGYFQQVPSHQVQKMMELEADRMKNLLFKQKDFEKEIKVIMEERRWRTEDRPEARLEETLKATVFMVHPYHWPVIGWMSDLEHMRIDDARAWYQRWYAPNNATLVVVGDVKTKQIKQWAKRYFGSLKAKKITRRQMAVEPEQKGIRRVSVKAVAENPMVVLAYRVPKLESVEKDTDAYALDVLSAVLDGYDNARLSSQLIRKEQSAIAVEADYSFFSRGPTIFVLGATSAPGVALETLEQKLKEQVQLIAEKGVTPEELERVKVQLIASQIYKRDSLFNQAVEIGGMEMSGIGYDKIDTIIEHLKSVTPEQVQDVAKRYFKDDTLTVAYLLPLPKQSAKEN